MEEIQQWGPLDPSIHKALASLDKLQMLKTQIWNDFDPQGSREPRRRASGQRSATVGLRSTRLSRASTGDIYSNSLVGSTSIHKALASLDDIKCAGMPQKCKLRSTRLSRASTERFAWISPFTGTSIHKALASLDLNLDWMITEVQDFDPQGSREPRRQKCTIILASMPHLHASYYTSSTNRLSS